MKMKWQMKLLCVAVVATGTFFGVRYAFSDEHMALFYAYRASTLTVFRNEGGTGDMWPFSQDEYTGLDDIAEYYCKSLDLDPDNAQVRDRLRAFFEEYGGELARKTRERVEQTLRASP